MRSPVVRCPLERARGRLISAREVDDGLSSEATDLRLRCVTLERFRIEGRDVPVEVLFLLAVLTKNFCDLRLGGVDLFRINLDFEEAE
jgi:hypothetical protein